MGVHVRTQVLYDLSPPDSGVHFIPRDARQASQVRGNLLEVWKTEDWRLHSAQVYLRSTFSSFLILNQDLEVSRIILEVDLSGLPYQASRHHRSGQVPQWFTRLSPPQNDLHQPLECT